MGSDPYPLHNPARNRNFNPRSPCGERPNTMLRFIRYTDFNPRSPCGERQGKPKCCNYIKEFQSTLPVWGATIHRVNNKALAEKFQSTLPVWGATPTTCKECAHYDAFQSTLPVWGATCPLSKYRSMLLISIHAPRVGSDKIRTAYLHTA